ncbi:MAG: response regulator [Cytophagales bacterium]
MGGKKALVVDDHAMAREALVAMLADEPLQVFVAHDAATAKQMCKAYDIAIAFVDARMYPEDGFSFIQHIAAKHPSVKVVGMSTFAEEATIAEFLSVGVVAFLPKEGIGKTELSACVAAVLAGKTYFSQAVEQLRQQLLLQHHFPSTKLSKREMEIATLLSRGFSHKEIGQNLAISKATVDDYKKNMLEKTKTKTSSELIGFLLKNGVLRSG